MLIFQVRNIAALLAESRFDMTVTLGNVLTIVAFGIAAVAFGIRIESRVAFHEMWIKIHQECSRQQLEILNELRSAVAYIKGRNGYSHRREDDEK